MKNSLKISILTGTLFLLLMSFITNFFIKSEDVEKNEISEGRVISIQDDIVTVEVKHISDTQTKKKCTIRSIQQEYNLITCQDDFKNIHTITNISPIDMKNYEIGDVITRVLPDISFSTKIVDINDIEGIPQLGNKVYINPQNEVFSSNQSANNNFICITSEGIFTLNDNIIYFYEMNVNNLSRTNIEEGKLYSARGSITPSTSYGLSTLTIDNLQEIEYKKDNSLRYQHIYQNCNNTPSNLNRFSHSYSLSPSDKNNIIYHLHWTDDDYYVNIPSVSKDKDYLDNKWIARSFIIIGFLFGFYFYIDSTSHTV